MKNYHRLKYKDVKYYIESFRYKLISKKYIKSIDKLNLLCPKGHEIKISFNKFKDLRRRCKFCNKSQKLKKLRHSYFFVKEHIESFGYELLSENYKTAHIKLNLRCPKNHLYKASFHKFKNGKRRCPYCITSNQFSNQEIELRNFIKDEYKGKILYKFKNDSILDRMEIDIYLPKLNIGIEYNGDFWHMNPKKYNIDFINPVSKKKAGDVWQQDNKKLNIAKKNGIKIIIIWENDWINNRRKTKENIKLLLK